MNGCLQQLPKVWLQFSCKHLSVTMHELDSVHHLRSGALALWLEGQVVSSQQTQISYSSRCSLRANELC